MTEQQPNNSTVDLQKELNELTEIKADATSLSDADELDDDGIDDDDEELSPGEDSHAGADLDPAAPDPETPGLKIDSDQTSLSDLLVQVIDMAQQFAFKITYGLTLLTRKQRQDLKQLWFENEVHEQNNMKMKPPTAYERWLLRKKSELADYEDNALPLDQKETKDLKTALDGILKEQNRQLSPMMAFIVALLTIIIPRMIPILGNMISKDEAPSASYSSIKSNEHKPAA